MKYYINIYERVSQEKLMRQYKWEQLRGFILFLLIVFGGGILLIAKLVSWAI